MTPFVEGNHTAEYLLSEGNGSISREEVTVAAAAGAMVSGTVVGKITASGKYVKSLSASADGSEVPDMVLAQDCDASAADKEAIAYETATVVATALTLGAGHTLASIREGLRVKGIQIDD